MNKQIICILLTFVFFLPSNIQAQESSIVEESVESLDLFDNQKTLPLKLNYSNKDLKRNTNDSTYIESNLSYQNEDGSWANLKVDLRARGNFRRDNCYFVPVKISIKKKHYKSTKFEGHKKLKLVVPCLLEKDRNDNVVKEYIAYKLYEIISPYHFKTRFVEIELTEPRGKKEKIHNIKGFLIEDDKKIAKKFDGRIVERSIHPLAQEELNSIRCEFFQFMIGNTDFSNLEQHNSKLIYIDKKIYPVPYDFDMSGLVNASYSIVSEAITNKSSNMTRVTQRMYRGFKRNLKLIEQVRQEYIKSKDTILKIIDDSEPQFENQKEFENAKKYIQSFFDILVNEKEFNSEILNKLRG